MIKYIRDGVALAFKDFMAQPRLRLRADHQNPH
jgi:hypothetical protein